MTEDIERILNIQREEDDRHGLENLLWFVENQRRLVHLYDGMYIVIRDHAVIATFHSDAEAVRWMHSKFYDNSCSCYHCIPGTQAYTIDL